MGFGIVDGRMRPHRDRTVASHHVESILSVEVDRGHHLATAGEGTLKRRVNASGSTRLNECPSEVVAGESPFSGERFGVGTWNVVESEHFESAIEANGARLGTCAQKRLKGLRHLAGKIRE